MHEELHFCMKRRKKLWKEDKYLTIHFCASNFVVEKLNTLITTNYQICKPKTSTFSLYIHTPLVFEHQAKMFVRQGVDSEHLKVCPHDQKHYALEPIDTDQFFFFCDSKSSESDSILGSYYAKRYTRLPTTHLVFRSFGAWITITSSTFFHHTFPSS